MHEVFGHSLKVKIFYVPFHFVDLDFGDYCDHENNFRSNVQKRQKMQLNLKKVRKKYNRSRSLKIISKNEFLGGKVEVDFWLLHSIIWLLINVFPGTKDQCNTEAEHSVWKGLVSRDP